METVLRRVAFLVLLVPASLAGCLAEDVLSPTALGLPCGFAPGEVRVPPLPDLADGGSGEATIRSDEFGVPHVTADGAYALFYANGYLHGRDRLFELDVFRHLARGDAASVLGETLLASDMTVRRDLYTPDEIEAQWASAAPALRSGFGAYSDGVNRAIAEASATGSLPGEFAALGHPPEPWRPQDSVAIAALMLGIFGGSGGFELAEARVLAALDRALGSREAALVALGDVNPVRGDDGLPSIARDEKVAGACGLPPLPADVPAAQVDLALRADEAEPWGVPPEVGAELAEGLGEARLPGAFADLHFGSNAMLVAGELSATGKPIMFGGPQMGEFKPPPIYEIGLHAPGFDVVGVGVAGTPGVVLGRTPTYAWTLTSGIDDMRDTVVLEVDPADRHRFRWGETWETMECRTETHRVAPMAAGPNPPRIVQQEVCRAHGMPVVAGTAGAAGTAGGGLAWAQRTTTRGLEMAGAAALSALPTAGGMEGFRAALETFPFSFNFHYAGEDGIAYYRTAAIPLRDPALDPRLPALAGDEHDWRGVAVGLSLGAWVERPSQGLVVNWNNAPVAGWSGGDVPIFTGLHRVELLDRFAREALERTGGRLAIDDVAGVIRDAATHDPFAHASAPDLARVAARDDDPVVRAMGEALEAWARAGYPWSDADGDGEYDHAGHAVWDASRIALQEVVFADELGGENPDMTEMRPYHIFSVPDILLARVLEGGAAHAWCDDASTPAPEDCDDALAQALEAARADLAQAFATEDVAAWQAPVHVNRYASIGAAAQTSIPMVNRGSWNHVVAIGQGLDGAWSILPPGESGLLTGPELLLMATGGAEPERLTSQLDMYREFRYKPFPVTPEEVDLVAKDVKVLRVLPAGTAGAAGTAAAARVPLR